MTRRTTRRGLAVLLISLCAAAAACSRSAIAPSPPVASAADPETHTLALTVRVQTRNTELPIPRAQVFHNGICYYADAAGEAVVSVVAGQETTIDVRADGYQSMSASGTLANDERWTFYLAVEPHQP